MCPCCPGGTPPEKKGLIREGNGLLEVSSRREGPPAGAALLESMLIGSSSAIAAIRRLVLHVAGTEANVMIHGESGTGKEVVARAIHLLSNRSQGPFVPVNMAAIPPGLAESLLFGHDMGSFTGAHQAHPGWCRAADGGTLFLDEIAEIELQMQPKLLRFLQEGTIQAVGAPSFDRLDVRIVTATNRDPRSAVAEGALREDLFFRLHVIPISIPPLRERREDIAELAAVFLRRASARHQRLARVFSADALEVLRSFEWPGNIRQLENAVERVVILAQGEVIEASDIPAEFQSPEDSVSSGGGREHQSDGLGGGAVPSAADLRDMTRYQRQERAMILQALQQTGGHVVEAARLLGLGQATVYRKIKRYAISRNSASRSKLRQPI